MVGATLGGQGLPSPNPWGAKGGGRGRVISVNEQCRIIGHA